MKNILILGALPNDESEKRLYETIINLAKEFAGTVRSPLDTAEFKGTAKDRYERALQTVKEADLVIGEQSSPSTGQGIEIRECALLNKPLIVVARKESRISGLVKGCPCTKEIILYSDSKELTSRLRTTLKKY